MTTAKATPSDRNRVPNFSMGDLVVYAENSPENTYIVMVTGSNPNYPHRFCGVVVYAGRNRFAELGRLGVDFDRASFTRFHGEVSLQSE